MVFLAARDADGSFLSCGAATTALLQAIYGIERLDTPEFGNFGQLALTATPERHRPPAPAGLNLTHAGWADPLIVERQRFDRLRITSLLGGRAKYVLDCNDLPGRGRLLLQMRGGPIEPALDTVGASLLWDLQNERPWIGDTGGHLCQPRLLRLSAVRSKLATPFVAGRPEDLFRQPRRTLPSATLCGELVWEVLGFAPAANGEATVDVRYLPVDLLRDPRARWSKGDPTKPTAAVQHVTTRGSRIRVEVPARTELRMRVPGDPRTTRILGSLAAVRGTCHVRLLADRRVAFDAQISTRRAPRWLQADTAPHRVLELRLRNDTDTGARIDFSRLLRVPRVPPAHGVRPPGLERVAGVHLQDDCLYGKSYRLPAPGSKARSLRTPMVLPAGPVALRVRGGMRFGAAGSARLSLLVTNRDGSQRFALLRDQDVSEGATPRAGLFLGLFEIPASAQDRVAFLTLKWSGEADLHLVDLTVIRP